MSEKSPVFVKVDDYRSVLDSVDALKKQVDDIRKTIAKIKSLRDDEAKGLAIWESNVDEVESHLSVIDKALFEPDI